MDTRWKPNVTVAAIIEKDGRYLLVEEQTRDGLRLNNPAGHLDPGESPAEGCAREALEETAHLFKPTALVGVYLSRFQRPATGEDVTYGYDTCANGIGRLCSVTDPTGTRTYAYDGLGRTASVTWTTSNQVFTTSYTWTPADRLASITYPSGRVVSYTRNSLGQISAIATGGQNIVTGRTYRADGLLTGQTYGNGLVDTRAYDLQGHLASWATGSIDSRSYGYDANGNITSINATTFGYDWLDRIVSSNSMLNFTWDANGNRQADGAGGYARELTAEEKAAQAEKLAKAIAAADVVISTAAIPGKKAPVIITREMVGRMKYGAIIVDMAAESGGNCELTQPGEHVIANDVNIHGPLNLPSRMPTHASELYAKNLYNFLSAFWDKEAGKPVLPDDDEITAAIRLTKDGKVVNDRLLA